MGKNNGMKWRVELYESTDNDIIIKILVYQNSIKNSKFDNVFLFIFKNKYPIPMKKNNVNGIVVNVCPQVADVGIFSGENK